VVVDVLSIEAIVAGLAGGAVGAAIGALPALSLAGLLVVVGETLEALGRALGEPGALAGLDLTATLGLGPALGPHVAFAGGVAAAAYAGRHGRVDTESAFFEAKDVTVPLGSRPDVLLAGATFGAVGVLAARLATSAALPVDPVALAVVLSAVGHWLAFGYPVVGHVGGAILDMTPYERDERRSGPEATGRLAVEPWQPAHYGWGQVVGLGVAVGVVGAYLGLATGSAFLAFGVAATLVLFRSVGLERTPIVYHIALPASIVALGLAAQHPAMAIFGGAVAGLIAAVLGELSQRVLFAHGDTYFDPAFASILLTSLCVSVLATAGLLRPGAVPYPVF
jgi:hypothetical protein